MANRDFSRTDRVADTIKRLLATLIQQEINDPRLGMVNINDVEVSRDLAFAKVFVTFIGNDDEAKNEASVAVLNKAAGYLRSLLAKALDIRTTPRLQFFYDRTPVHGQALSSLIDRAVAEDRSNQSDESDSASQ